MNFIKKIYCRTFQSIFKVILPIMPYKEPKILNSILDIKKIIIEKNLKKPLIVTDKGISSLGLTNPLTEDFSNNQIKFAFYDKVVANPTIDNVEQGRKLFQDQNCDCLIAFGGGSAMDCAKAIGARIAKPQKTISQMKGLLKIRKSIPLLIAIPTTAGTGSETTLAAVITDKKTQHKYPINDFALIPSYAVLDATLTVGLPKNITSTTGMDALTHAIEAYIGHSTTKYTREKALNACKLIFENIEEAYNNPTNLTARSNMLKASFYAGIAFTRSYVGYVHAIAHSLGGQYNTPHGLANAVILPIILKEYGNAIYKKTKQIADYCNISKENDSKQESTKKLIAKIEKLNKLFDLPSKFDFIKDEDIKILASHANNEGNPLYPVPKLFDKKELESIYYKIKK